MFEKRQADGQKTQAQGRLVRFMVVVAMLGQLEQLEQLVAGQKHSRHDAL